MAQYGKQEYWDSRYTKDPDAFEWYQAWPGFRDIVSPTIRPDGQILVVGCGNSGMSEELYNDGFSNIVNVDFSPVVIKSMQEKCKDKNGLQCMNSIPRCFTFVVKKMDMRELDFPDGIFHSVLDKATLDSVLCAEGSLPLAAKCLSEISRVLESGGVFVSISHGAPNTRMQILDRPEYGWTVSVHTVPKPMLKAVRDHISPDGADEERVYHYVYVCAKQ